MLASMKDHPPYRWTFAIRRFLRKRGWITDRSMIETFGNDYTLREKVRLTFDSVWWDLSAPMRLVGRAYYWLKWKK